MRLDVLILETFIQTLVKMVQKSMKRIWSVKNIDAKYYASDYFDKSLNKYKVKTGTFLRFWENKGWIKKNGFYGWFHGILGTG